MTAILTEREAAGLAEVKPAQLRLWLESGQFKTANLTKTLAIAGYETTYYFNQEDVTRLIQFARQQRKQKPNKEQFVDDGKQENFTVAQVASMWQLSPDTIQRWFQNEPGVVASGDKNPRGKRRRVTLRIPREVMLRVKKQKSNR